MRFLLLSFEKHIELQEIKLISNYFKNRLKKKGLFKVLFKLMISKMIMYP